MEEESGASNLRFCLIVVYQIINYARAPLLCKRAMQKEHTTSLQGVLLCPRPHRVFLVLEGRVRIFPGLETLGPVI